MGADSAGGGGGGNPDPNPPGSSDTPSRPGRADTSATEMGFGVMSRFGDPELDLPARPGRSWSDILGFGPRTTPAQELAFRGGQLVGAAAPVPGASQLLSHGAVALTRLGEQNMEGMTTAEIAAMPSFGSAQTPGEVGPIDPLTAAIQASLRPQGDPRLQQFQAALRRARPVAGRRG